MAIEKIPFQSQCTDFVVGSWIAVWFSCPDHFFEKILVWVVHHILYRILMDRAIILMVMNVYLVYTFIWAFKKTTLIMQNPILGMLLGVSVSMLHFLLDTSNPIMKKDLDDKSRISPLVDGPIIWIIHTFPQRSNVQLVYHDSCLSWKKVHKFHISLGSIS